MTDVTHGERQLSACIEDANDRGPGTVWRATVECLAGMLKMPASQVGAISIREKAVIGNRLVTPGVVRNSPTVFLVASLEEDYGMTELLERTIELVPKTRHLTTVLIAHRVPDPESAGATIFRVTDGVAVDGLTVIDNIRSEFPALSNIVRVPLTPLGTSGSGDVNRRAWYVRGVFSEGMTAWFGTAPASNAPAIGERVLFVEDGAVPDALRTVAHGRVAEVRVASTTAVDIVVRELRRPIDVREVAIEELRLSGGEASAKQFGGSESK